MAEPSEDLQKAIFDALIADPVVSAIVGDRVSDGRPEDYPSITFGPSDGIPDDMDCIDGSVESVQLDCWVRDGGRLRPARALADKVKALLHNSSLSLANHALASIEVTLVRAFMDPDGLTAHGVVQIEAMIEVQ